MSKGSFPVKARFRRAKKVLKNNAGKVVKKWSKATTILCTLPSEGDMGVYTYGVAKCSRMDDPDLCYGKGIAYDRAKDALALNVTEVGDSLCRRGKVKKEDLKKVKYLFDRERFDTEHWHDNPSAWELRRWGLHKRK